ncbi:sigma-70 family RNA polymerase sigma factor [Staphylococcus equorum]|uniref:Sigma-70 family RNA polymerase sigma factor n=1 Tax=Staphylococcus equorum TaxID=246432 RepID=A0A9X4R1X1_9STAP|nr:sigma-70 family RNA polymerase sigma factor [Staphylococcus equorum]MDG0860352.1 sigma-70 family RNA polymerase sigma factor [Staphylococcus equorum]
MTTAIIKEIRFSTGEVLSMTFEEVRKRFYPTLRKEVRQTNNKFIYNKTEDADFLQELEIELWRAFNDYEVEKEICFSTYLHWKLKKGVKKATFYKYAQKNQHNGMYSMSAPIGSDDLKLEDMFSSETDSSEGIMYETLINIVKDHVKDNEQELLLMLMDIKKYPVQVYADKYGITRQAANQRLVKFKNKLQDAISNHYFN